MVKKWDKSADKLGTFSVNLSRHILGEPKCGNKILVYQAICFISSPEPIEPYVRLWWENEVNRFVNKEISAWTCRECMTSWPGKNWIWNFSDGGGGSGIFLDLVGCAHMFVSHCIGFITRAVMFCYYCPVVLVPSVNFGPSCLPLWTMKAAENWLHFQN